MKILSTNFYKAILLLGVSGITALSAVAQVSGMIFQDFNANGTLQNTTAFFEPGQSGVVVNAYNAAGVPLPVTYTGGGSTTNSTGEYSVPSATPGQVRLEFIMPDAYTFASRGNNGGTTVMFPTGSTQNLAVNYPRRFCQNSPNLVTPCFVNGRPPISANFDDVIVRFPYSASGTTNAVNNTYLAQAAEIGATWGMAYDRANQHIYTSAFLKRHVGLRDNDADGKEDIGAIYRMTPSGSATFWLDIATLGADVGLSVMPDIASRGLPNNNIAESNDAAAFPLIGKVGLGDIDISDDGKQLFVVSLYDKKVYTIDIATQTLVGSGIAVPNPCTGGEVRPFGLSYHKGKLYVGTICDALSTQSTANLSATVYRLDGVTFTSVLSFPLNYPKGAAFNDGSSRFGTQWNPWRDVFYPMIGFNFNGQNNPCLPQPMLVNIEFDVNDDMIMLFNDRLGHQTGTLNWGTNPADNANYYSSVSGGDLLRASWNGSSYTLENNGMVGGLSGMSNNEGPGGGEFYWGDRSLNGGSFFYHEENIGGGGTILAGTRNFAVHVADPINAWSAGTFWLNNTNGQNDRSYQIFGETYNVLLFGKANGLGDLELLCDNAPIEIGNRVWADTDNDGVQDPGEAGIGGIEVQLWKETTPGNFTQVATVTTDANGNYYFSSASGTSTTGITFDPDVQPNMNYQLRFPTTSGALSISTKPNMGGADPNADARDTDASAAGVISFSTGGPGENDHTFDVGYFMCTTPTAFASVTQPTCAGGVAQSNGAITISGFTAGQRYQYSSGATFNSGAATPASITAIPVGGVITSTLPNTTQQYTVRIYDATDDACFVDRVVSITAVTCVASCDCKEYIYLNEPLIGSVLKFEVVPAVIPLTERLGANGGTLGTHHWYPGTGASQMSAPHGLGTDLNGNLWIGATALSGPIRKLDCDGTISATPQIATNAPTGNSSLFNMFSIGNTIYTTQTGGPVAYNSCDGTFLGKLCLNDQFGNPLPGPIVSPQSDFDNFLQQWGLSYNSTTEMVYASTRKGALRAVYRFTKAQLESQIGTATCIDPLITIGGSPTVTAGQNLLPNDLVDISGVVSDNAGNIYVVGFTAALGANTEVLKYGPTGGFISRTGIIPTARDGQGIVWSETTGRLYMSNYTDGAFDCISAFDTNLNYLGTAAPNPNLVSVDNTAKAIAIIKECCPTNLPTTFNVNVCGGVGQKYFLNQEAFNSMTCGEGIVCGSTWVAQPGGMGMTFESCDNSVTITGTGCTTFTLSISAVSSTGCPAQNATFTICNVLPPTATAAATQPTCAGGVAQSNGAITISGFTAGQRYQYSSGATFNSGAATPASITAIPVGGVITSTLPNTTQQYTVRIYDATDAACFVDRVVSITAANCCTVTINSSTPTACVPATNTYSLTVNVSWTDASGTSLTVTTTAPGATPQVITTTLASSGTQSVTFTGLTANATMYNVTAQFDAGCTATTTNAFTAPPDCSGCVTPGCGSTTVTRN